MVTSDDVMSTCVDDVWEVMMGRRRVSHLQRATVMFIYRQLDGNNLSRRSRRILCCDIIQ